MCDNEQREVFCNSTAAVEEDTSAHKNATSAATRRKSSSSSLISRVFRHMSVRSSPASLLGHLNSRGVTEGNRMHRKASSSPDDQLSKIEEARPSTDNISPDVDDQKDTVSNDSSPPVVHLVVNLEDDIGQNASSSSSTSQSTLQTVVDAHNEEKSSVPANDPNASFSTSATDEFYASVECLDDQHEHESEQQQRASKDDVQAIVSNTVTTMCVAAKHLRSHQRVNRRRHRSTDARLADTATLSEIDVSAHNDSCAKCRLSPTPLPFASTKLESSRQVTTVGTQTDEPSLVQPLAHSTFAAMTISKLIFLTLLLCKLAFLDVVPCRFHSFKLL